MYVEPIQMTNNYRSSNTLVRIVYRVAGILNMIASSSSSLQMIVLHLKF